VDSIDFQRRKTPYLLASGGMDGTIRLWQWSGDQKVPQGQILDRLSIPVYTVAFSPGANILAVGAKDKTVRVYDLLTKKIRYTLTGHTGAVTDLAFNPDGTTLASSDDETEVRLWDMATGELTNQPKSGVSGSMHLAFSPASGDLTGGFGYNSVLSYKQDPGDLNDADILIQHTSAIFDLAYNQDGTRFADASEDCVSATVTSGSISAMLCSISKPTMDPSTAWPSVPMTSGWSRAARTGMCSSGMLCSLIYRILWNHLWIHMDMNGGGTWKGWPPVPTAKRWPPPIGIIPSVCGM